MSSLQTNQLYSAPIAEKLQEGVREYALKNYQGAADCFSEACAAFAESHEGEDDPYLLLKYGKTVFEIAKKNSEVLGGAPGTSGQELTDAAAEAPTVASHTKSHFSFSGDQNIEEEDSNEEEKEEENTGVEDSFESAWDMIDLSRIQYEKALESLADQEEREDNADRTAIMKNLAECYDVLGEISIENENFVEAVSDLTKSLNLKLLLFHNEPQNRLLTEAHYKLSLALEFVPESEGDGNRILALEHMEKCIESLRSRIEKEGGEEEDKDMLEELKLKANELRNPTSHPELDIKSLLNATNSSSASSLDAVLQAKLAEATDLTSFVRKKVNAEDTAPSPPSPSPKRPGAELEPKGKRVKENGIV